MKHSVNDGTLAALGWIDLWWI